MNKLFLINLTQDDIRIEKAMAFLTAMTLTHIIVLLFNVMDFQTSEIDFWSVKLFNEIGIFRDRIEKGISIA